VWFLAPNMRDDWSHRLETTHVQSELDDARDGDWNSIQSIAGSILSHCDVSTHGDFVPDDIAEIASNVLADRNVTDDDIDEMLAWYEECFDEDGEPIVDDDDDDDDGLCTYCEKNQAAWDCCYDECGNCCDESDCERHGWD